MHHLEHVDVASDGDLVDTRFPVQYAVRPRCHDFHNYRVYAGRVTGGVFKPGDSFLRGQVICHPQNAPKPSQDIYAMIY